MAKDSSTPRIPLLRIVGICVLISGVMLSVEFLRNFDFIHVHLVAPDGHETARVVSAEQIDLPLRPTAFGAKTYQFLLHFNGEPTKEKVFYGNLKSLAIGDEIDFIKQRGQYFPEENIDIRTSPYDMTMLCIVVVPLFGLLIAFPRKWAPRNIPITLDPSTEPAPVPSVE